MTKISPKLRVSFLYKNVNLARTNIEVVRRLCTFHEKSVREVTIPVPWGKLAGKWWGSTDIKPLLCVHGMQENCGTFDRLIPQLNRETSFLAIDLPGHGHSSHFPNGIAYEYFTYPQLVNRILEHFKWSKISFLGHSAGAMMSYGFATAYPDKVGFLMCIDAFKNIKEPLYKESIRFWLDKYLKYEEVAEKGLEPLCYTLEEIHKKISEGYHNSINLEYAHYVAVRNILPSKIHPGKYYFKRDRQLKSPLMLLCPQSQEEIIEDTKSFTNPIFICKTAKHTYLEDEEKFYEVLDVIKKSSMDCEFHKVGGTHNIHLNEPEKIANLMNEFMKKHHRFEESGVKESQLELCDI